jgi:dihydrofolate reductase
VIGGASLYAAALPRADRLLLTRVRAFPEGDVRFPELDESDWILVAEELRAADEKNPHDLAFRIYERVGNRS